MAGCTHCCAAQAHFDARIARHDLQQYKSHGPDAVTRLLLSEVQQHQIQGRELLDIGAGIGVISCELANNGISRATLVEASPAYLEVAGQLAGHCYQDRSAQFILGDYAAIAPTLEDADIVTLGRVVCCYPDFKTLLQGAAARTRQILALTYPRDRWYVRIANALENLWRRLTGNAFRTYVHAPGEMASVLESAGLVCVRQKETLAWALEIYQRNNP